MENDNNLNKKEILNINDQNQNEPQQEVQKQINIIDMKKNLI